MKKCGYLVVLALAIAICPALHGQGPSQKTSEQANREQVLAAVQQICPVSGNKLGAHGVPIKVKIGKEEVYLCCKGCLKGKIDAKHWATIHANFAKAQVQCPVMKKPLPKIPTWTIVQGRIVYVCCPPCAKKIEANPEPYLELVDNSYAAFIKNEAALRWILSTFTRSVS